MATSFFDSNKFLRTNVCLDYNDVDGKNVPESDKENLALWPTGAVCCLGRAVEISVVTSHSRAASCAGPCCFR